MRYIYPAFILLLTAMLYFIWPTVHTIALRKLLLVILFAFFCLQLVKNEHAKYIFSALWFRFFALLFGWVFIHAAVLSENGSEAWKELLGQWLPAYLALFAGIGLALLSKRVPIKLFWLFLMMLIVSEPAAYFIASMIKTYQDGKLAMGYFGPEDVKLGTDLKMSITIYTDILAAFSSAKILELVNRESSVYEKLVWPLLLALAFFVAISTTSANGIIMVTGCSVVLLVLLAYQHKDKITKGRLALFLVIAGLITIGLGDLKKIEYQFSRLSNNVIVGASIYKYPHWINPKLGLPESANGYPLMESFYYRAARAVGGAQMVIENPLGYGVTRKAFERLMQQKYPEASIAHTENGYLNLMCAIGIPGMLLLLMAVISALKQMQGSDSEWAKPGIWIISAIACHWALDAIERDHFFEIYMFLIGLLATLTMTIFSNKAHNDKGTIAKQ